MNEVKEIGLDDEYREETTEIANKAVIHRDITESETETNQDTLNKVIEDFPDDTSRVNMEEFSY